MRQNTSILGKLGIKDCFLYYPEDEEEWFDIRRRGITGTDISVIMGCNPYKTQAELLEEKLYGKRQEQTEPMFWGTVLEDVVAKVYSERSGERITDVKGTFSTIQLDALSALSRSSCVTISTKIPLLGNLDRIIVDADGKASAILEVKTGHAFSKGWGTYDIPEHYRHQVNWYMGITKIYKAVFAVLLGGRDYRARVCYFDQELFDRQEAAAKEWYRRHVINREPLPEAIKHETADDGKKVEFVFMDDDETQKITSSYYDLGEQIKQLEEERKGVKEDLLRVIGDNRYVKTGSLYIKRIAKAGRTTFDSKALAKDDIETYNKYIKVGSPTEELRVELGF
jgi:putative phage-type endonuclease